MGTWRGRGVVVLTPKGRLSVAHVARVRDAVPLDAPAVAVVDLVQTDTVDTDAVAALLRTLSTARRAGWQVIVANPTADVEVALRPLSIHVVDTTEGSPYQLPDPRPSW